MNHLQTSQTLSLLGVTYPKQEKRDCVRDGYRDRYTMKIVMLSGRHEVKTQQEIL